MTRLFNRKDKTTIAELEEYYSSNNKKNRSGIAWLMALLSLVLTIIIIVALFFLARWIYRAVTDDDSNTATVTESENGSVDLPSFDGDVVGQGNQDESNASTTEEGGVVSDEAAVTEGDDQNSNERSTGSSTSENSVSGATTVPDTGAGEMIVLIPIATGVAGYYVSRRYLLKQQ